MSSFLALSPSGQYYGTTFLILLATTKIGLTSKGLCQVSLYSYYMAFYKVSQVVHRWRARDHFSTMNSMSKTKLFWHHKSRGSFLTLSVY